MKTVTYDKIPSLGDDEFCCDDVKSGDHFDIVRTGDCTEGVVVVALC